jgi:hypothetical protein
MKLLIYIYVFKYYNYDCQLWAASPTSGGRSFGIVRLRTKATEFSLVLIMFGEEYKL